MDIAALSISLNEQKLMQDASLAVTKQTLDIVQQTSDQLVEMIDAPHPILGKSIDISI